MKTWEIGKGGASWTLRWKITREFLNIPVSRRSHAGLEFINDEGVPTRIIRETRKRKWLFFIISNGSVYRRGIKSVLKEKGIVTVGAVTPRRRW